MAKPTSSAPPTPSFPFLQKPQTRADLPQLRLVASPNSSQNPSRRSSLMPVGKLKRGHAAGGDGGPALLGNYGLGSCAWPDPPCHSDGGSGVGGQGGDFLLAELLGALDLGSFAGLGLPAPPDGLDLTAKVDHSSDCIIVSVGGDSIMASPVDLAEALSLPRGTVPPAAEYAALFCSVEAITAMRVFVHDRLLLGGTGDGLPDEATAALRLVEEGKAYAVDWGRLVWAFLRSDVMNGKRQRCSQYLLRLMKCQRPDLFSEVDGRFLGKGRKGLILQQRRRMDGQLVDCNEVEVEEENYLHGNSGYDQLMEADVEVKEGLVFGLSKNIGELEKMPAFEYVNVETEDQEDGNDDDVNVGSSLPSFRASQQQIVDHLSYMEKAVLDWERTWAHNLAEIQQMREKEMEKNDQINSIVEETEKELQERATKLKQLEHYKMVMVSNLHGCIKRLQKSSAACLKYRKMMCQGNGVSSLDAVAHQKNQCLMQQQQRHAYEIINGLQKPLRTKFSACDKKITVLLTELADLNHEVQRLKESRSVIDLNVEPHL